MDCKDLCKRFDSLKAERTKYEPHWDECYRFGAPERAQSFFSADADTSRAKAKDARAELLDATAVEANQLLGASIISGTTPANELWFKAVPDGIDDLSRLTDGERWLEDSCNFIWRNIHASNFDSESPETITDITTAGNGVLFIDEDRKNGGLVFESWHFSGCYFASTRADGRVDTIYREVMMSAGQVVGEYGEDACSLSLKRLHASNPDQQVKILYVICPRPGKHGVLDKALPFAAYHIEADNKHMLKESGYHEFPCAVARWKRIPGSVYGIGQMSSALPDAKTANNLMRTTLQSAELAIGGMWLAEDDGVLNPHTVRIGPRKVIAANSIDSMKRLDTGVNFEVSDLLLSRLQGSIRKKLMADQLQAQDGPAMTATEVHVRVDLIRQQLGPIYGRMQSEYLMAILDRCFGLALRAGVLGQPPEELQGTDLSFKFISPLARAQQLEGVTAIQRLIETTAAAAQADQSILDNINLDNAVQAVGSGLGVPQTVMRSIDNVKKLREARVAQAEQQKAEAQAEQQQQAVGQAALDTMVANNTTGRPA